MRSPTAAPVTVLASLPLLYGALAAFSFWLFDRVLKLERRDSTAMLFCSTHKTLAFGVPLIRTMFESSAAGVVGWATAPLLIWHPTQLVVGSFLCPKLQEYIASDSRASTDGDEEVLEVPFMYNI